MSTFNTINVALSGLRSTQKSIEVTSHNVANVNTPGYHRQEAVLRALPPVIGTGGAYTSTGQVGTGVEVAYVRRMENAFLQQQSNIVNANLGRWTMLSQSLQQIESYLAPGQGLDLSSMLDRFFGSWQLLATHPEDIASRLTVRSTASSLVNTLNDLVGRLDFIDSQVTINIDSNVTRLNQLAEQLASINVQIGMARAEGREPSDYLDQRDTVLADMTRIAGVSTLSTDPVSGITTLGGRALVAGSVVYTLSVDREASGSRIVWDDGTEAQIQTGELAALYEVRREMIPSYKAQLDTIARTLAEAVNALHQTGVTIDDQPAGNFFEGDSAGSIRLADAILANAGNIAATTLPDAPGDGSLATDIYRLFTAPLINGQTLNQGAQGLLSQIGNAVQGATLNMELNTALRDTLFAQQQQVGGVSLDEEMANLLMFQRAYDASARVLAAADEMLRVLLDRLG